MKHYSFYDLKKGDIYEHIDGSLWIIGFIDDNLKCYASTRVNDVQIQRHRIEHIKQVWFCDC